MFICKRCEARHKETMTKCSVCGFPKPTEWKAAANREGIVAISSPPSPKDMARIKIGWKNTVKSIENNEGAPRPGRWVAFYIPTSYMAEGKEAEGNGFRVELSIKLLTKGSLRYHGRRLGSEEFTKVAENSFRLSKPQHGWHYAQVQESGTEANHVIDIELEERAYARCEESTKSKPVIPWTFWYFPFSTATLPVAYLNSDNQQQLAETGLQPIREKYVKEIEVLKEKRIEDENQAKIKLDEIYRPQLKKADEERQTSVKDYETRAETAKENKKAALLKSFEVEKLKTENLELLKTKMNQDYGEYVKNVDKKLEELNREAEQTRIHTYNNLKNEHGEKLLRIRESLDLELKTDIEKLQLEEEKVLRKERDELVDGVLMAPLVTFSKYFSANNPLKDAGKAVAWESNPENAHCGDKAGWTGHCDAGGFASAMFDEPIDKGIWKGEELKFIVTEYLMSYVITTSNSYTTWQLGETDNRNHPPHLNFVGHFKSDLNSELTYAKENAVKQTVAAGKNGASLLEKLQAALFYGMPVVMDMRVNRNFKEETRVPNAKAVWNHCVFCYTVRYRESADATGEHEDKARDMVAHITIYANKDHSPPTSTKPATIKEGSPPDITLIPQNCIVRQCAVRLQFAPNGKINIESDKADWLGCHAEREQKDDLDFEYKIPRLPPRYLTLMVAATPIKKPMANPHITPAHIEALVKDGFLKWSRKF